MLFRFYGYLSDYLTQQELFFQDPTNIFPTKTKLVE